MERRQKCLLFSQYWKGLGLDTVQIWAPCLKKGVNEMEGVQRRAKTVTGGLESMTAEARLKERGLFSLEKRGRRDNASLQICKRWLAKSKVINHSLNPLRIQQRQWACIAARAMQIRCREKLSTFKCNWAWIQHMQGSCGLSVIRGGFTTV